MSECGLRGSHRASAWQLRGVLGDLDGRVQDGHCQHNLGGEVRGGEGRGGEGRGGEGRGGEG